MWSDFRAVRYKNRFHVSETLFKRKRATWKLECHFSANSVPFQSDFLPFSTPFVAFTVDNAQPSACLIKLINDGNEEVHGWMDWRRERGGDKSCIRPQFNRSRMLPCHSLSSNFTQGHVLTTTTSIGNNWKRWNKHFGGKQLCCVSIAPVSSRPIERR